MELLGTHCWSPPGLLILKAACRALLWVKSHQQSVVLNVFCGKLKVVFMLGAQVASRDSANVLWMFVCIFMCICDVCVCVCVYEEDSVNESRFCTQRMYC